MKNLYEELDTMCLRCECRVDLKCGRTFHCKAYNSIHNALKILEELTSENAENEEIHDVSNTHVHKAYKLIKKTTSSECAMWSDTEKISYIEGIVDFAEELGGNAE